MSLHPPTPHRIARYDSNVKLIPACHLIVLRWVLSRRGRADKYTIEFAHSQGKKHFVANFDMTFLL